MPKASVQEITATIKKPPVTWNVVSMEEVEDPPSYRTPGKYRALYEALVTLPEGKVAKVCFEGDKTVQYAKTHLKIYAKRDGLRLLSSRTADNKTGWFWLGPRIKL